MELMQNSEKKSEKMCDLQKIDKSRQKTKKIMIAGMLECMNARIIREVGSQS